MSKCAKDNNGVIHVINPLHGSDYTLCGNAQEGDTEFSERNDLGQALFAWIEIKTGVVDCPKCIEIIEWLKRIKVKKARKG